MLRGSLNGRGPWGRMDTCICMAESLPCSPETITTLLISYTPIKKKLKNISWEWFVETALLKQICNNEQFIFNSELVSASDFHTFRYQICCCLGEKNVCLTIKPPHHYFQCTLQLQDTSTQDCVSWTRVCFITSLKLSSYWNPLLPLKWGNPKQNFSSISLLCPCQNYKRRDHILAMVVLEGRNKPACWNILWIIMYYGLFTCAYTYTFICAYIYVYVYLIMTAQEPRFLHLHIIQLRFIINSSFMRLSREDRLEGVVPFNFRLHNFIIYIYLYFPIICTYYDQLNKEDNIGRSCACFSFPPEGSGVRFKDFVGKWKKMKVKSSKPPGKPYR